MIPVEKLQEIINLSKKANLPELHFDETNQGGAFDTHYGLVSDTFEIPGIDIRTCRRYENNDTEDEQKARAKLVCASCNAAYEMADEIIRLREKIAVVEPFMELLGSYLYKVYPDEPFWKDAYQAVKEALEGKETEASNE